MSDDSQDKKSKDGILLSFAIIIFTGIISLFKEYVIPIYQQALTYKWFIAISLAQSIAIVLVLFLGIFILLNNYSLISSKSKEQLIKYSCLFSDSSFLFFVFSILVSTYLFLSTFYLKNVTLRSIGLLILTIVLGIGVFWYIAKDTAKANRNTIVVLLALVGLALWGYTFGLSMDYKSVEIQVEMEELYEFDHQIIPISVRVNGYNNALDIEMYQENESHTLNPIDANRIYPYATDNAVEHSKYIFGNYLDDGNYIIFINSTGLESGYYELHMNVNKTNEVVSKGFYFIDDR